MQDFGACCSASVVTAICSSKMFVAPSTRNRCTLRANRRRSYAYDFSLRAHSRFPYSEAQILLNMRKERLQIADERRRALAFRDAN